MPCSVAPPKNICSVKDTTKRMKKTNHRLAGNTCTIYFHQVTGIQNILNSLSSVGSKQTIQLENGHGTSLVAQWLRIRLPMQGTRVWSLVQEDPTCHGATKPMHHNYWTCTLEPTSHNYWACMLQLLKPTPRAGAPQQEKPPQWEACAVQWRVAPARRN